MEKVYEFLYNSSCCESAAATISIHKTPKGAEMAMEFHKNEIKAKYEEDYPKDSKDKDIIYMRKHFTWDWDQYWGTREANLEE